MQSLQYTSTQKKETRKLVSWQFDILFFQGYTYMDYYTTQFIQTTTKLSLLGFFLQPNFH